MKFGNKEKIIPKIPIIKVIVRIMFEKTLFNPNFNFLSNLCIFLFLLIKLLSASLDSILFISSPKFL